jgi:hypothetical protein
MAPCNWSVDTGCCPGWADYTPEQQAAATTLAVNLLDRLTGYQFSGCPVTVRPCGKTCSSFTSYMTWPVGQPGSSGSGSPWMIPFVDNGVWRNCGCTGGCTCRATCEVLIGAPVVEVTEVTIDGVALDPSAYRLDRDERGPVLVRTDGDCFPECQSMDVAPDEVGAFTVTYVPGAALPADGPLITGMLACQLAKACAGGDCVLPQQLQSLSRNGMEVQVLDPSTLPESILTGIAEVDRWVRSVNPGNLRARPRVLSSDVRPHRVVTP